MVKLASHRPSVAVRRSTDYASVRQVASELWAEMNEPSMPDPVDIPDSLLDGYLLIEALLDGECAGFFAVENGNFHAMLRPCLRGSLALEAGRQALDLIRALGLGQLHAYSHAGRAHIRWFAHQLGFRDIPTPVDHPFDRYTLALS